MMAAPRNDHNPPNLDPSFPCPLLHSTRLVFPTGSQTAGFPRNFHFWARRAPYILSVFISATRGRRSVVLEHAPADA